MKRWISGLTALGLLAALVAANPAKASMYESHVKMDNFSDAWVWVTAYTEKGCHVNSNSRAPLPHCHPAETLGAWCVGPHTSGNHNFGSEVYEVRAEVTHRNCAHPVLLNQLRGFPQSGTHNTMQYFIKKLTTGQYIFGNY